MTARSLGWLPVSVRVLLVYFLMVSTSRVAPPAYHPQNALPGAGRHRLDAVYEQTTVTVPALWGRSCASACHVQQHLLITFANTSVTKDTMPSSAPFRRGDPLGQCC